MAAGSPRMSGNNYRAAILRYQAKARGRKVQEAALILFPTNRTAETPWPGSASMVRRKKRPKCVLQFIANSLASTVSRPSYLPGYREGVINREYATRKIETRCCPTGADPSGLCDLRSRQTSQRILISQGQRAVSAGMQVVSRNATKRLLQGELRVRESQQQAWASAKNIWHYSRGLRGDFSAPKRELRIMRQEAFGEAKICRRPFAWVARNPGLALSSLQYLFSVGGEYRRTDDSGISGWFIVQERNTQATTKIHCTGFSEARRIVLGAV